MAEELESLEATDAIKEAFLPINPEPRIIIGDPLFEFYYIIEIGLNN